MENVLLCNVDKKVEFNGKLNSIHSAENLLSINPLTLEWKIVFHKFNGIHDSTVIFHEFCGILHNLWKASFPVEFSLPKVDDFPLKSPNLLAHPVCQCTKTQF